MESKQQKQIDDELVEVFKYYSSYEDLPASRLGKDDLVSKIRLQLWTDGSEILK